MGNKTLSNLRVLDSTASTEILNNIHEGENQSRGFDVACVAINSRVRELLDLSSIKAAHRGGKNEP